MCDNADYAFGLYMDGNTRQSAHSFLCHCDGTTSLPHSFGNQAGSKLMDRMTSYLRLQSPTMRFVLIAPRRSNAWEMRELQQCCNATGVQTSYHQWCAMGAVSPQTSLPLRMTTKCVCNFMITDYPCKCGTEEHGYDMSIKRRQCD